jgi:hypothetical protein
MVIPGGASVNARPERIAVKGDRDTTLILQGRCGRSATHRRPDGDGGILLRMSEGFLFKL